MARLLVIQAMVLLYFVHSASAMVNNTIGEVVNDLKLVETRRHGKKNKHARSTSSSSREKKKGEDSDDDKNESLDFSSDSKSSSKSTSSKKKYRPKSSAERRGWRKWHRKCTPCPEMSLKWRDPSIGWICGGYQRARRSFKSACMMRLRNCQDGTMFVKIHDHRCGNDTGSDPRPHGYHFFYDYKVKLSGESSKSGSDEDSSTSEVSKSTDSDSNARRVMSPETKMKLVNTDKKTNSTRK